MSTSPVLPANFTAYNTILHKSHGDGETEPGDGRDKHFNQSFEDVKEMIQDGCTLAVLKTTSVFRREKERRGQFSEYSLILRRITDVKSNARPKIQLEIQSDRLRDVFAKLASNLTTIRLSHDPIVIPEPYMEVYYCREKIQEAVQSAEDPSVRAELQLLVDFQQQYMFESIRTIKQFKSSGYIEFEWLWALFPPGELVVIENRSASAAPLRWCATVKTFTFRRLDSGMTVWSITTIHTGFNGVRFGNVETSFTFPSFSNNLAISGLPAYPLKFCKDAASLKKDATRRGRNYVSYARASSKLKPKPVGSPMWQDGPIWTEREPGNDDRRGCRFIDSPSKTVRGRVIVDFEGFFAQSPTFRESLSLDGNGDDDESSDSDFDSFYGLSSGRRKLFRTNTDESLSHLGSPEAVVSLSDDELLTCPPLVPMFHFTARQWCLADIDDLKRITWKPDTYGQLQIDPEMKEAIQSLVRGYSTHATSFDDFIEAKGCGLVFLLHGPPGCGKTMTAETISESLEKPLYHISGGELGDSVVSIQDALETAFDLAARWDALLLLDEADAFLAKRDGADIGRNSLISIFLRLLEYQPGIIFLTTNRFGDFDPAFESRIHLQIPFPELDASKRQSIWDRLARKNGNCTLSFEQITALGRLPLDGRRIKNILRMASLFAADRNRTSEPRQEGEGHVTMDQETVPPTMGFDDIKKVLPLAIARVDGGNSHSQESIEVEDSTEALAELMEVPNL